MSLNLRFLITRFDGVIHSQEWKEALWDRFVTAALRPRTPSELNTAIASFALGTEPGVRDQSQDGCEVAEAGDGRGSENRPEGTAVKGSDHDPNRRRHLRHAGRPAGSLGGSDGRGAGGGIGRSRCEILSQRPIHCRGQQARRNHSDGRSGDCRGRLIRAFPLTSRNLLKNWAKTPIWRLRRD